MQSIQLHLSPSCAITPLPLPRHLPGQSHCVQPQTVSFSGSATPRASSAVQCNGPAGWSAGGSHCPLHASGAAAGTCQRAHSTPQSAQQPKQQQDSSGSSRSTSSALTCQGAAVHHHFHLSAVQRGATCRARAETVSFNQRRQTGQGPSARRAAYALAKCAYRVPPAHPAPAPSAVPAGVDCPGGPWRR